MTPQLRKCDEGTIADRLAAAQQFLEGARIIHDFAADEQDIADAYVTLCVHSGVAAADVICCIALGANVRGEDHDEALAHLSKVRPDGTELANSLRVLLGMKTRARHGQEHISTAGCKRAERAAQRLLDGALQRRTTR